jgi:hypothetical protein
MLRVIMLLSIFLINDPRITAVSCGDSQNISRLKRGLHTRELWNITVEISVFWNSNVLTVSKKLNQFCVKQVKLIALYGIIGSHTDLKFRLSL